MLEYICNEYQCVINVLSMCYQCVINVLSMCYQCVINVLSMCYGLREGVYAYIDIHISTYAHMDNITS